MKSSAISDFVSNASSVPISQLPRLLDTFPQRWPLPRGDLYHWIPLLNRFDNILEQFIQAYGLDAGPQGKPFGTVLLTRGVAAEDGDGKVSGTNLTELEPLHFSPDGDRQLVEYILRFSRTLLENCGNRSLYGSSERLSDLLNTTSLSLLSTSLQLMVRLAQRYHASRQRTSGSNQNLNNALLASHYNIDLEKVQKLAEPFAKLPSSYLKAAQTSTSKKGKEKPSTSRNRPTTANANDMLSLIQTPVPSMNGSGKQLTSALKPENDTRKWEDWEGVSFVYYPVTTSKDEPKVVTPTPSRRASSLSKTSRLSTSDDTSDVIPTPSGDKPNVKSSNMATVEFSSEQIKSTLIENLMDIFPSNMAKDAQYDLLSRLRVAHAIMTSFETRQEIVGIRLLALTNLAYIYTEDMFKQKILQRDSDEPRNLQLVQLLCDMLHPPPNKPAKIPVQLQTFALGTLEAFVKLKTKASDVCSALSVNVNHGVLFFLLRKAVADMGTESPGFMDIQLEEWREAVFALLDSLPASTPRTGEALISAGVLSILVEILNLRTPKAERSFPKTLTFLNNLMTPVRDAFQTLATVSGLEAISALMAYEVTSSLERAQIGQGLQPECRNRVVDYQIPFYGQQTLRMIFKIIREMMTNSSGNFDRLLRNFIDSPKLLGGLRTVIVNPISFGSNIWSGAVNIMSSFIHNEPTSYAVISEAGLSKGLLETLSRKPVSLIKASNPTENDVEDADNGVARHTEERSNSEGHNDIEGNNDTEGRNDTDVRNVTENSADLPASSADTELIMAYFRQISRPETASGDRLLAKGVLPATEPIIAIPHALGALCLNQAGMRMVMETDALDNFLEIFESPAHVKVMTSEQELGQLVGQALEELVRHHPSLKIQIFSSVVKMIGRVQDLCLKIGKQKNSGAKLWLHNKDGRLVNAGSVEAQDSNISVDGDVLMEDLDTSLESLDGPKKLGMPSATEEDKEPSIMSYITALMRFLSGFSENQTTGSLLVDAGVAERVLDVATLPVLAHDQNNHSVSIELKRVMTVFAEAKPHLVLPALLQRTQSAVDKLKPLHSYVGPDSFFSEFTSPGTALSDNSKQPSNATLGTTIAQSLVAVHTLCDILAEVFFHPPFNSRSTQTPFSLVNLTDIYINLIKDLGSLHRVCVWEEILLMKRLPESWAKASQLRGFSIGSAEADKIFGLTSSDDERNELDSAPGNSDLGSASLGNGTDSSLLKKAITADEKKSAAFQNSRILRYLLGQIPAVTTPFFRSLGKSLLGKRRSHTPDPYLRQNASMIADAISTAYTQMFTYEPPNNANKMQRYSYWIVILTSISRLLIEGMSLSVAFF